MQPPGKVLHLLVGALLVAGYYLGLPGHLWQPAPAATLTAEGWRPARGELEWHVRPVARLSAGSVMPLLSARPDGTLVLYWQQGEVRTRASLAPGSDWEISSELAASTMQWLPGIALQPLALSYDGVLTDAKAVPQPLGRRPAASAYAGRPLLLADGSRLLPLQRGENLEILRLDDLGRPIGQYRPASVRDAAPPIIFADSPSEIFLFHLLAGETVSARLFQGVQAGQLWREWPVSWPAPPRALVRQAEQRWWLLADSGQPGQLRLYQSQDRGQKWQVLADPPLDLPRVEGACVDALDAMIDPRGLLRVIYLAGDCRLWLASLKPGEP